MKNANHWLEKSVEAGILLLWHVRRGWDETELEDSHYQFLQRMALRGSHAFVEIINTGELFSNNREEDLIYFDETACDRFSLEADIDEENWSLFQRRAKIPAEMEPVTALRSLHLIGEDDRMTRAGAWLLARDIRKFNISADVVCTLFMGTRRMRILNQRDFHGDVYSMIDEVMAWILSKINVEYIIKHVKRDERPELPEEAMREAVVNALAHRDYRSTENVRIDLFKDRLEVVSPGGLPAGMTEANLGSKSIPRNPLLFGTLHRMKAVEKIGSGICRIRDLCREHGVAEPVIEVSEHWVTTTFTRPRI